MACALCLGSGELQQSHIIPEFHYSALYDERHRYNVLSTTARQKDRIEQKGQRERLLCRECELRFSKLERYASLVFKGGAPGMEGSRAGNVVSVTGLDYAIFKLFLLSVIWRMGAARGSYFEKVDLGSHYERLRSMLLAGDPGPFDLYPCIFFGITMDPGEVAGVMIQPTKAKSWGHTTYHVVVPGMKLVYFISSHRLGRPASQFLLQEDGSLVFQVRSALELPELNEFMRKFETQGRRAPLGA